MAPPYYLCAYGDGGSTRLSARTDSPEKAAKECYGVVRGVTCLRIDGKGWRCLSDRQRRAYQDELARLHAVTRANLGARYS